MDIYGKMMYPPEHKEKFAYFKLIKNRWGKFQWRYCEWLYMGTVEPLKPNGFIVSIPYDRFLPPFHESQLDFKEPDLD